MVDRIAETPEQKLGPAEVVGPYAESAEEILFQVYFEPDDLVKPIVHFVAMYEIVTEVGKNSIGRQDYLTLCRKPE